MIRSRRVKHWSGARVIKTEFERYSKDWRMPEVKMDSFLGIAHRTNSQANADQNVYAVCAGQIRKQTEGSCSSRHYDSRNSDNAT